MNFNRLEDNRIVFSNKNGRFLLKTSVEVRAQRKDVFSFFSDARNLEFLTPAFLNFRILTPGAIQMEKGTLIDYRITLHGIPLRWRTRIAQWAPPESFVDEQLRGPYSLWVHTHSFEARGDNTCVTDLVEYSMPFGRLVHPLFVKGQLRHIFTYRRDRLLERFPLAVLESQPS